MREPEMRKVEESYFPDLLAKKKQTKLFVKIAVVMKCLVRTA
jgi:hypothetical protein